MSTARNNAAGAHERRCRYASKRCENPRAVKRNGELHRFCEYHREKANLNQKRNDQKKKESGAKTLESSGAEDDEQELQRHQAAGEESKSSTPSMQVDEDEDDNEDNREDEDEGIFFNVGDLDISQLDPDELDDKEIEELQALVVAGHLEHIITETEPAQRIDDS